MLDEKNIQRFFVEVLCCVGQLLDEKLFLTVVPQKFHGMYGPINLSSRSFFFVDVILARCLASTSP